MTLFRYKALTVSGAVVAGTMDAVSEVAVVARIREFGHIPISATSLHGEWLSRLRPYFDRKRFSYRKLDIACQELSALLNAGVDLERSLSILQRLGELGQLQRAFAAVHLRVREGGTFGDALAAEEFPPFLVSGVRAGESAGSLGATLRRLSEYISRTVLIRDAVVSALLYPAILLVVASLSIFFILIFVLPEFKPLFDEAGRTLPLPTRIVMGFGDLIREFWWLLLATLGSGLLLAWHVLQKPEQRLFADAAMLKIPVLGPLLSAIELERFGRTLGTLLTNGVDLGSAVPVAKEAIGNRALKHAIGKSVLGLREGGEFADQLAATQLFPTVMLDLIRIGEETGHLDDMLLKQADLDEQRIRYSVNRLLAMLVPALTIVMGLFVGGLIASIVSAILSVNELALPR